MNFDVIERKMQGVGLSRAAIDAFRHSVNVLTSEQSMMIPEIEIEPARDVADWEELVAVAYPGYNIVIIAVPYFNFFLSV